MSSEFMHESPQAFNRLRHLARRSAPQVEHCELCSIGLRTDHPHLVDLTKRRMLCACDACALLFSGRSDAKFKRVPRDVRRLDGFHMTDAEWDGLMIPINLAFFVRNSSTSKVTALYPSPAGATESLLPLDAWSTIVRINPVLSELQSDVEALLVNRVGHARGVAAPEYYIAPIDRCYQLVGLIRVHWRGLSGGEKVWQEIGGFFAGLRSEAQVITNVTTEAARA